MLDVTDDTKTRWGSILLLWGIGLAAAMQFAKFSISLPNLVEHYSVKESVAALMLSSVGIMGIILGAAAGAVVGTVGTRRSLVAALVVGIIASLVQTALPPYELMLISRLFEGISHLLIVVAAPTAIISCSSEKHKAFTMGLWATFFGVAYAITGLAGVPIQDTYGTSFLYGSHAAVLMLLIVLYLLFGERAQQSNDLNLLREVRSAWSTQFQVYGSLAKSLPALVFFWHTLMFVALLTFLPGLASGNGVQKFLATALPIITIFGSFAGGAIAQKIKRPLLLMTAALATFAILSVATGLSLNSPMFVYVTCATMFVSGVVQASTFSAIPQLCQSENDQAQANGAVTQLGNLGATCGTPIFALGISVLGANAVPLLATVFATLAVIMLVYIGRNWPSRAGKILQIKRPD